MPRRDRRQKEDARRRGESDDVRALIAVVNDGAYVFPHAYAPKSGGTQAVWMEDVRFDANTSPLHAEVKALATAITDQLVVGAALGDKHPQYLGGNSKNPVVVPGEAAILELSDARRLWDPDQVSSEREAARTTLFTIRDAVQELVNTGAYRCLRRCGRDACRRVLFTTSDSLMYCQDRPCRQAAAREIRTQNALKGQTVR